MKRQLLAVGAGEVAPALLGVAAFACAVFADLGGLALALTGLALALVWLAHRPPRPATAVPVRVLLAAAMIVPPAGDAGDWPYVAPIAIFLLAPILLEGLLNRVAGPWSMVVRLPVPWRWTTRLIENGTLWLVNSALVVVAGVFANLVDWDTWPLLVATFLSSVFSAFLFLDGWRQWRSRHRDELANLRAAVERHRPAFVLYFSAPTGSEYQATMWLPHLERLGQPFVVVLPEADNLAAVSAATRAPVVVCLTFEALDAVMVESVHTAFYVNNGMKNAHSVRYGGVTHVQLYHGDSDKAVTASPLNAMFDQIFVAGQAAIDRFAAYGVSIPAEKFRIVGRPQVAELAVACEPIGTVRDQVVLYAPTWRGAYADLNHCSLPIACTVIQGLLDRGVTVVLRPHPYTRRNRASALLLDDAERMLAEDRARTGRAHRFGVETARGLTLHECMNLSHAMICDVSSVASEYLYSGKPFAIADVAAGTSGPRPPAANGRPEYVLAGDASNLDAVLDDLLVRDPLEAERRRLRTYYLGDFPPERYADAFVDEARRALTRPAHLVRR